MPVSKPKNTTASSKSSKSASSTNSAAPRIPNAAEATKAVSVIFTKAGPVLDDVRALTIRNADDLAAASDSFKQIQAWQKEVREKKAGILDPINVAVKNIRALFKPAEDRLEAAREFVSEKMSDYVRAKEIADAKEQRRLEARGDTETRVVTAPARVVSSAGTTTFQAHKEVVIENEALIPRKWLVPDLVAIRRAVLAGEEIPGVRVHETKVIR